MQTDKPMALRGRVLVPGAGPFVFGILNVTPDSFSDGGRYRHADDAIAAGCRMAEDGADAIDVGGESTRPGSGPVASDEQVRRIEPVIAGLWRRFGTDGPAISIDTRCARVAEAALDAGATIINDISALRDDEAMADLAARRSAGVILMHMKGTPATMQEQPAYVDVIGEIKAFLAERIDQAIREGINRHRLVVDPGIGFGKTTAHNLAILARIDELADLGVPVLTGPSRKRFIGDVLGLERPGDRLPGTAAAVAACILAGVECVRVHDILAMRQVADTCSAIRRAHTQGRQIG